MVDVNSTDKEAGWAYGLHLLATVVNYRMDRMSDRTFQGWEYMLGATRVVWHQQGSDVVYKVDLAPGANFMEHENAVSLRRRGMSWAPETRLHRLNICQETVLAMNFYPFEDESLEEVPEGALYITGDLFLANYKRTDKRPKGIVKMIDLTDPLPLLLSCPSASVGLGPCTDQESL